LGELVSVIQLIHRIIPYLQEREIKKVLVTLNRGDAIDLDIASL
jgi:hypothetical protein